MPLKHDLRSAELLERLQVAMGWVIPSEIGSPGADTEVCVAHLLRLVEAVQAGNLHETEIPTLREQDLANSSHPFAPLFIQHVRDIYYGFADTGAWDEMGFVPSPLEVQ